MNKGLLCLFILSIFSCNKVIRSVDDGVYFGGEIVNPTNDYVVLFKNDQIVDSVKIDANNQFEFVIDSIEEGLYHFTHAPEQQYVYFEKGDSILIRLNTVAFDESLVFSGTNDDINNFLIEMFLNYEDEEQFVYSLYTLPPEDFKQKIDSLRNQKMAELNDLGENATLSNNAMAMAKAAIDYNSFLYKEKYPFYHKKYTGEETMHQLDEVSFYSYRRDINVNEKDLVYFRPYYEYMKYHFGNLSYMACAKNCGESVHDAKGHYHLYAHKLQMIDSSVQHESLRNNLLRSVATDILLKEHQTSEGSESFLDQYIALSTNEAHQEEVRHLYEGIKRLQPNERIPDVTLTTFDGETTSLKDVAKSKKTVVYFWSGSQKKHMKNVTEKVAKLKQKHPETRFVGICVMTLKPQWTSLILEYNLEKENQFWSDDMNEIRNKLVVDGLNKCLIVEDSIIRNGFGNLYTSL